MSLSIDSKLIIEEQLRKWQDKSMTDRQMVIISCRALKLIGPMNPHTSISAVIKKFSIMSSY